MTTKTYHGEEIVLALGFLMGSIWTPGLAGRNQKNRPALKLQNRSYDL